MLLISYKLKSKHMQTAFNVKKSTLIYKYMCSCKMYIWTWSGDYACVAQSDFINLGYLLSIPFLGSDMM